MNRASIYTCVYTCGGVYTHMHACTHIFINKEKAYGHKKKILPNGVEVTGFAELECIEVARPAQSPHSPTSKPFNP